jgi:RNA polymerase sigma-70 factor (ECF subfamily)
VSEDAGALARARAGDPSAFTELVHDHDRQLRALAFRLLGDRQRMDDVLQNAYARAFRSLPSFRGDATVSTWLYRIVYNACLDEPRRGRRTQSVPLEEIELVSASSEDTMDAVAQRLDLAAALASLPPDQRAAVLLVDAQGMDYAAAAEVLGIAPGTVGSRLARARSVLRAALGQGALR